MNATTLRRLLADRDGGALSEDVVALLDAHVKLSPPAQSAADEYSAVIRDVRSALDPGTQAALPVFPRNAVIAALKSGNSHSVIRFRSRGRLMGLAAAACVVFAFFAGRLSHLPRPPQGETQMQVAMEEPTPRMTSGIWSIDPNRRAPKAVSDSPSTHIKWNSPLEWSVTRRS